MHISTSFFHLSLLKVFYFYPSASLHILHFPAHTITINHFISLIIRYPFILLLVYCLPCQIYCVSHFIMFVTMNMPFHIYMLVSSQTLWVYRFNYIAYFEYFLCIVFMYSSWLMVCAVRRLFCLMFDFTVETKSAIPVSFISLVCTVCSVCLKRPWHTGYSAV